MNEQPVLLDTAQRERVESICRQHADIRGWHLYAAGARSNHVHLAVAANSAPQKVRDQFKANATRVLRQPPNPIENEKVWTRGGDIEVIEEEDLAQVIAYITDAQDRMDRGRH